MNRPNKPEVMLIFDPGYTTGFAAMSVHGRVWHTAALPFSKLETFIPFLAEAMPKDMEVVCEVGPEWQHHSPIARKAEQLVLSAFPNAHRIPPNRWKNHPASKLQEKYHVSVHERDAIRLGKWFLASGGIHHEGENRGNTTGKNAQRS